MRPPSKLVCHPAQTNELTRIFEHWFPAQAAAPIRALSQLHPDSRLVGRIEGDAVAFVKTYQGASFHGYKVGEIVVGTETEGHDVQYEGKLSSDQRTIEGRWWIAADPSRGFPRAAGLFMLRREPD